MRCGHRDWEWLSGPPALICRSAAGSLCHCLPPSFCPMLSELKINPYTHMQRRTPQGTPAMTAGWVLLRCPQTLLGLGWGAALQQVGRDLLQSWEPAAVR